MLSTKELVNGYRVAALLYEVLYDKVFGVSNIVSAAAESMKRFGLPTDDVEAVKIRCEDNHL
jgi:hypothetical protein